MKDKLDELFELQSKLQLRLKNFPFKDEKHQQEFINLNFLACLDELSEALRETAWKNPNYISCGWKQTQNLDQQKFKSELVDLWHFVINLSIAAGFDSTQLHDAFLNKNKENHERQDKNY